MNYLFKRRRSQEGLQPLCFINTNIVSEVRKGRRCDPNVGAVAKEWGRLNANRPLPVIDGLLAATAKTHCMTLVTRNAADTAGLDISMFNPFELR